MKISNRILLITIVFILFTTAVFGICIGIFFFSENPHFIKFKKGSSDTISKEYPLADFTAVHVTGFWAVNITKGDSFDVTVSAPEYAMEYILLDTSEGILLITQSFFTGIPPVRVDVSITMPSLVNITSDSSPRISFTGFKENKLVIETSGSSKITGSHSHIINLVITGTGMVNIDLVLCTIINANLVETGSGTIALNMVGGTLSGIVQGSITITYTGSVSEQSIEIYGSSQLIKKEDTR